MHEFREVSYFLIPDADADGDLYSKIDFYVVVKLFRLAHGIHSRADYVPHLKAEAE